MGCKCLPVPDPAPPHAVPKMYCLCCSELCKEAWFLNDINQNFISDTWRSYGSRVQSYDDRMKIVYIRVQSYGDRMKIVFSRMCYFPRFPVRLNTIFIRSPYDWHEYTRSSYGRHTIVIRLRTTKLFTLGRVLIFEHAQKLERDLDTSTIVIRPRTTTADHIRLTTIMFPTAMRLSATA